MFAVTGLHDVDEYIQAQLLLAVRIHNPPSHDALITALRFRNEGVHFLRIKTSKGLNCMHEFFFYYFNLLLVVVIVLFI